MQENNFEQPPSLSQLLRESYLAEARAQQRRGEMSHSDSASSRFQVFLPLKGKGEDAGGQNDSQFPDLSAFLSQEELDKSVNLAQQAIGKKPQEVEVKASASPLTTSNSSSSSVLSSAPPSVVLNTQPMGLFSDASTEPSMEVQKTAGTHSRFTSERKMHKSLARQDGLNRNIRDSAEEFNDRHVKGAPYNLETQSKKEFLNKAADFIEELSSLFKANSSKRVRPRACKAHRTRAPSKGQNEETGCPLSSEDRERAVMPVEVEKKRCSPPVSHLPTVLQDPECAQTEVQKCRSEEEPDEAVSQKAQEQAECLASTETPFQSETVCEPPRFIQKLKSREVLEGTKVQLDCIVAGHPAPEVRWFCEGKELENSPDIQILSSGQLHSLIIAEAFEEDTGRYSCFASNFCGTDSTSAEIYVEGASSSDSDVEQLFDHVPQLQRKPYKASVCRPSVSPARPTVENKLEAATEEPAEELSTPLTTQTTPQSVPAQIPTELPPVPDHSETSAALPLATEPPVLSVQLSSSSSGVPAEESSIPSLSAAPTETSGPLNTVVSSVQPVLLHPAPTETSGPLNPVVSSVQPVLLLPGTTETSGPLYPMVSSVLHSAPTETSEPLNPVVSSVQSVLLHPAPTKISGPLNPVVSTVQPLLFHPSLTETSGPLQPVVSSVQPVLLLSTQTETSGPLNPVVSSVQPVLFHPAPTAQLPSSVPNHSSQQASDVPLVMAAPVFTKSLQDFTASQGQLVVLECRVKGAPSPQVDWFREGKPLEDSPDYRILQKKPRSPAESEEICTLVIAEVFAEDSGMFTCTASNKYGTVSSSAALKVKGDGSNITHIRPLSSSLLEPGRVPEAPTPLVKTQPEISVSSSIKPHSSTISLDPLVSSTLRLDPLSISHLHLEPHSYTTSRPDPHRTSLPISSSATNLEPGSVNQEPFGFSRAHQGGLSGKKIFPHPKPGSSFPAAETSSEQGGSRPSETLLVKKTSKNQNQSSTVVSLPDPPPNSCLKTGTMTNHKDPRSGSRVGLRVHFKLPEDEEYGSSSDSEEDVLLASAGKEPPPVRAKPKLDPSQLQLLHNQVLMEQQQESESQPRTSSRPPPPSLLQPEVQSAQESSLWPPRMQREPQVPVFQSFVSSAQQISGPPPTTSTPASALTTAPTLTTTVLPPFKPSPAPPMSFLHTPHAKTLPPPVPLLSSAPALSTPLPGQSSTIHASHLNLSPAALSRTAFSSPPAPKLSILPTDLNAQQITSPAAVLRSAHASLMNLTSISSTFNYARPKEFIAAQAQSPIMSPSPTESPVPLLQELAAELNSSAASSPIPPPFSPPLRLSPTRVLKSPTSPPSLVSSPTPGSFLNSMSFLRAQSPPQASSPTSSSSSPSPIQNPVAFLSSVLPSLTPSQPTNAMGLPKGAPRGVQKKTPKVRLPSAENIRESKELLLLDLEKLRLKDSAPKAEYLQKRSVKGETASRLLGPNIPATVFNYDEEYKVSNFEQRLMSEIEFRLERTPVEESDEEVQHDDVPSGRCIAPIFDKKLKNFKAVEGVPVTFSCKVVGVPPPKVYWFKDGKQILRKNTHYKKMREGDGTCALHIESTTSDDDGNYTVMVANPQVLFQLPDFSRSVQISFAAFWSSGTNQLLRSSDRPNRASSTSPGTPPPSESAIPRSGSGRRTNSGALFSASLPAGSRGHDGPRGPTVQTGLQSKRSSQPGVDVARQRKAHLSRSHP
ncbi:Myopalladin [Oryzias melastigma]|uniref:Myopalladin n=1 Tax=Oryzias melastigma TaxID=30732 RepID=A0A834CD90_ORYME|nr:Myopalladin [Oryzias melastigma]